VARWQIGTPHNMCQTDQMQTEIAAEITRAVKAMMAGEVPEDNFMVNDAKNGLAEDDIFASERWRAKLAAIKTEQAAAAAVTAARL
jgi:hypothetical protein